ncbi:nitrile hydratase subunit alpha [Paraburkholderia dilworthii]|uniref:nitrile hydratase subunit alpha n=1 Tax=Paraburkholderia dilworthii TaxID=948106 RepID=UPI0004279AB3|nr:nitrile hydratase subunit alpha [Paraburkholderia dilworthii]
MNVKEFPPLPTSSRERAFALFDALKKKDLIPDGFIEEMTDLVANQYDPSNGARIVARAWTDPAFYERLMSDSIAAVVEMGYIGAQGEYPVPVVDTPTVKNVIVCSLCSCTNWPVLGLAPEWYKSFEFRARLVREGREVLQELGTELPPDMNVQVWDTTAESRYFVLPMRPAGSEGMTEEELRKLVTKDVLIGVALPNVA